MRKLAKMACTAAGIGFAVGSFATAAPAAKPKADQTIAYYLPKAVVGYSLTRTLKSCPTQADPLPLIKSEWAVVSKAQADPSMLVKVDVSNGFLAKRSNAFTFHPNGTLAEFNSSTEGQGGAILSSVIKAAGVVLPMLAGMPPAAMSGDSGGRLYCSKAVQAALAQVASLDATIEGIEDKIALGNGTSADVRMLDMVKAMRKEARKPIVKVVEGTLLEVRTIKDDLATLTLENKVNDLPVASWFVSDQALANPGAIGFDAETDRLNHLAGYQVRLKSVIPELLRPMAVADPEEPNPARRVLVYRTPILAGFVTHRNGCSEKDCDVPVDLESPLAIPQWGKREELAVGHAGIFGSRQASAKFDAFGTPLSLSYGSDSGATAMAGTIDAATATVETLRDAETAELKRQIEKQELRQKLRDLQAGAAE